MKSERETLFAGKTNVCGMTASEHNYFATTVIIIDLGKYYQRMLKPSYENLFGKRIFICSQIASHRIPINYTV